MGLDVSIYRVCRKKAETAICVDKDGIEYLDYWSITNDVKSIFNGGRYYKLKYILDDLTANHQCEYHELTKLKAYHLLHCMKQNSKDMDNEDRQRRDDFVRRFKQILHLFDWDCEMMVWNWS